MQLDLKKKIIGISLLSALLPTAIVLLVLFFQQSSLTDNIIAEVDGLAKSNLKGNAESVLYQCEIANEMINTQLKQNLYTASDMRKTIGSYGFSPELVSWEPINQETKQTSKVMIPKMTIGGQWFGQVKSPSETVPYIDELAKQGNCTATIFQRMNEAGDMLRIATNVISDKGNRAIGTYIPVTGKDGQPNKVLASVLKGKTYYGTAFVVNKNYQTVYEPIKDASGKVVGMTYIGISADDIQKLRESVLNMVIGKTGYVYILNAKGINKGAYVISAGGKRDGENILNAKDANGNTFIKSIVEKAVTLQPGDAHYEYYPWKNPGDPEARMKIAAIMYYEPFDWVIGAGSYEEEFREAGNVVKSSFESMIFYIIIASIIIIGIMILVSVILGGKIASPIIQATHIMTSIADGDLQTAKEKIKQMLNS